MYHINLNKKMIYDDSHRQQQMLMPEPPTKNNDISSASRENLCLLPQLNRKKITAQTRR